MSTWLRLTTYNVQTIAFIVHTTQASIYVIYVSVIHSLALCCLCLPIVIAAMLGRVSGQDLITAGDRVVHSVYGSIEVK